MTAKKTPAIVSNDVDAIAPEPGQITLTSGSVVRVERLKTRQLFKLLKIVTRGAGSILADMPFSTENSQEFGTQLVAVIIGAVPEAEDEAIEFINEMVSPIDLIARPRTKEEKESNQLLLDQLAYELYNPEIEDTYAILEAVVLAEADDIQALGKRILAMFKMNLAQAKVNSSSSKN